MAKRKPVYSAAFQKALKSFQEDNRLTVEQLGEMMRVPTSTASKWVMGLQAPGRARLKRICTRLNWSQDDLFSSAQHLHTIVKSQLLSFEVLAARYADMLGALDMFEAMRILETMALLVYQKLATKGHACRLEVRHLGTSPVIFFDGKVVPDLCLVFESQGVYAMSFLSDGTERLSDSGYPLTALDIDKLSLHLNKLNGPVNHT